MLTVIINIASAAALGASIAWAGQKSVAQYPCYRLPSLWALLLFMLLVYTPAGAYLLLRYPDWSLMYLVDSSSLPLPAPLLSLLYPLIAVTIYLLSNRLLLRGRRLAILAVFAASLLTAGLIILFASRPIELLGTTAAYRDDASRLRSLGGSPLWYALVAINLSLVLAWAATTWRLWLLGRTTLKGVIEVAPTQLRGGAAPPSNGRRRNRRNGSRG